MAQFLNDSIGGNGGLGLFGGCGGDNGVGLIALLALLGRRGFGEGDTGCNPKDSVIEAAILNGVNGLASAVPTTALETQAATAAAIASLALGTQQGLSGVKDSVQLAGAACLNATNTVERTVLTSSAALLSAVAESKYDTAIAIRDDGDKTRAQIALYHEADLQRQLAVAQSALSEERSNARIREVEVNVTQTATNTSVQAQAQLQQQQQFQLLAGLVAAVNNLAGDIQAVKQGQVIFNSGTMAASGTQAAANTKVA